MSRPNSNPARISTIVFVLLNAVIFAAKDKLSAAGVDYKVLLGGNILLFLISLATTALSLKALKSENLHAFTRAVYAGFLIRLMVSAAAAAIYIVVSKEHMNKYGLFGCMAFYFIYTFIEVSSLQKLLKQKKNA